VALIEVESLYKTYRLGEVEIKALNGINLTIEAGEFVVLAGPSGSGKTTLLNIIGALDMPDSGVVRIGGEDFLHQTKDERAAFRLRHIGFVFQAYNLIRVLSARENIAYVLQLQGMKRRQRLALAEQLLTDVGLAGHGDRRPDQLSGGQQQRVAVARALATRPDIVLADEPTANLDSVTGEALVTLMEKLNREQGMTFLLSSHDPMVISHARRLIRMHDGHIVSDGSGTCGSDA
jgi:putative ABC transport system ATP-binding protein